MKNFTKLVVENGAILIGFVVLVVLIFGMVYVPVVRSALAFLGLFSLLTLLGYTIYDSIQELGFTLLSQSLRDYKESDKDYYYYKIYISELSKVVSYSLLLCLMSGLAVVFVYYFFISLNQPELFETARYLFASIGVLVGTLFLAIFVRERKKP